MSSFKAIASPPVQCPLCKGSMLIVALNIENNIETLMYGYPPKLGHTQYSKGQEILVELACICGTKARGRAEEVHASPSDILVKNIRVQEAHFDESSFSTEEDTFNPSWR